MLHYYFSLHSNVSPTLHIPFVSFSLCLSKSLFPNTLLASINNNSIFSIFFSVCFCLPTVFFCPCLCLYLTVCLFFSLNILPIFRCLIKVNLQFRYFLLLSPFLFSLPPQSFLSAFPILYFSIFFTSL